MRPLIPRDGPWPKRSTSPCFSEADDGRKVRSRSSLLLSLPRSMAMVVTGDGHLAACAVPDVRSLVNLPINDTEFILSPLSYFSSLLMMRCRIKLSEILSRRSNSLGSSGLAVNCITTYNPRSSSGSDKELLLPQMFKFGTSPSAAMILTAAIAASFGVFQIGSRMLHQLILFIISPPYGLNGQVPWQSNGSLLRETNAPTVYYGIC